MTFSPWFTLAPILLAASMAASPTQEGSRPPRELRVEMRTDPVAIDDARPRFSWELDDPRRGAGQSAYQILVATSAFLLRDEKGDAWDSQKVLTADAVGIEYAGKPLVSDKTYWWQVRTWDAIGKPSPWSAPASFGVGPIGADAWSAAWLRAGRAPDASSIGHKSELAKTDDAWPWVQLDFGGNVKCDHVRLHPARPDGDASKPGVLFPLRVRVYTDQRGKFEDKSIRIAEYVWQDLPNAGSEPLELDIGAYTLRYLRIVAAKIQPDGDRGYAMALGEIEVLDAGKNIATNAEITVSGSSGEPGWTPAALNDGALVPTKGTITTADSLPRLRGSFTIDGPILHGYVHATALGNYSLTLNGSPVGDARLSPGWTDYSQRVPYQTYDVTKLLVPGDNVLGVQLAPGWYAGGIGIAGEKGERLDRAHYGVEPAFYAQGEVVLENAKRIRIRTDGNWRWNRAGPVVTSDLVGGETRDNRKGTPGWDTPGYVGGEWRPVEVANDLKPKLFAQRAEPIRTTEVLPALSVREAGPTTYVYDFGQPATGVVRIRVAGKAGDTISLRYANAVDEKGHLFAAESGVSQPIDHITLRGGVETLEQEFALHGFRYVEVEGFPQALQLDSIEAQVVGSDLAEVGSFTCSDDTLNSVWRAALRSVRSNFVAIPTDCPQRAERLGWLGDVGTITPFALHALDASNFLSQWLADVRAAQTKDGRFPDFAPFPLGAESRFHGAPGWGDAAVSVPWEIYLRTHDLRLLRSSASSALAWVKFVAAKNPDFVWRKERGNDYADWLNTSNLVVDGKRCEGCAVQPELFATAFFAHSARTTAKMGFAVGDLAIQSAALEIANRASAAFQAEFAKGGRLAGDTQAAYALALDFGLCASPAQEQDFADRLAARIREQGYLTCGLPTAHRAMAALSRHGHHELALDLARRTTLPSWGHMLQNGSSTTWPRADGLAAGSGFAQPGPDAFNHFAFGAIGEWMVCEIAGLQLVDTHVDAGAIAIEMNSNGSTRTNSEGVPPWSRIRFAPRVGGGLTHAAADHHSIAGMVRSAWKLDGDSLAYECTVPPGCTATLDLPTVDAASITLDGKSLSETKELTVREGPAGSARIDLASGTYHFGSKYR